MTELMERYEAETGEKAISLDGWGHQTPTIEFMEWKEIEITKMREEAYARLRRPSDQISHEEFLRESAFSHLLERLVILQKENAKLRAQLESLEPQTIEKFQEIIRNQCDEISALKAQLTWRPVTQKPEERGYYLVKTLNFILKAYFDGEKFLAVVDQKPVGLIATHWLPIPPAPEGGIV